VVLGACPTARVPEEARLAGLAWEGLPDPKPQLTLGIYFPAGEEHVIYLGPHTPHLTSKEVDLLHRIWLELSNEIAPKEIHHHDIVHFAMVMLQRDLSSEKRQEVMDGLLCHLETIHDRRARSA